MPVDHGVCGRTAGLVWENESTDLCTIYQHFNEHR